MSRRPTNPHRPPGQRQLRVAEQIRHILMEILREGKFRDPELADTSLITVTAVEIGPDLKHATAFVMPLGGKAAEQTVDALNRAGGYVRSEVAGRIDLRYTPKVTFKFDTSFDESARIEKLLREERVQRDVKRRDENE